MSEDKINVKQANLIAHALGGKNPKKWYRNYFVTGEGSDDFDDLCQLEQAGFMERAQTPSFCAPQDIVFIVTEKGKGLFR
jgi:hypothetical protein